MRDSVLDFIFWVILIVAAAAFGCYAVCRTHAAPAPFTPVAPVIPTDVTGWYDAGCFSMQGCLWIGAYEWDSAPYLYGPCSAVYNGVGYHGHWRYSGGVLQIDMNNDFGFNWGADVKFQSRNAGIDRVTGKSVTLEKQP